MSPSIALPLVTSATALVLGVGLSLAMPVLGVPGVWRAKRARPVWWIGGDAPSGEDAEAVRQAIVSRGLSTYGDVARSVADELARRDYRRLGPNSDVGLFGVWYLVHACRVLERLDGTLVRIGRR